MPPSGSSTPADRPEAQSRTGHSFRGSHLIVGDNSKAMVRWLTVHSMQECTEVSPDIQP